MTQQAAQNQHYVPKFILRKFLANKDKERVNVFQKSTGKTFQTSIANIMAERRFNEFLIDENLYASFEDAACHVEGVVLPAYEALVERQNLTQTPEETEMLGLFVAFQMLRTRAYRDQMRDMYKQVHDKFVGMGFEDPEIDELGQQTEDDHARNHLESMADSIEQFSLIIGQKDFVLMQAPTGRSFYLADNPVVLNNDEKQHGIYGNLGLSVKGIQIFVPLTSRFMLAAFCPSILENFRTKFEEQRVLIGQVQATIALSPVPLADHVKATMEDNLATMKASMLSIERFISATNEGTPLIASDENMDFYNAMQVEYAREFLVCERGDFDIAKRFVAEHGADSRGWQLKVG